MPTALEGDTGVSSALIAIRGWRFDCRTPPETLGREKNAFTNNPERRNALIVGRRYLTATP